MGFIGSLSHNWATTTFKRVPRPRPAGRAAVPEPLEPGGLVAAGVPRRSTSRRPRWRRHHGPPFNRGLRPTAGARSDGRRWGGGVALAAGGAAVDWDGRRGRGSSARPGRAGLLGARAGAGAPAAGRRAAAGWLDWGGAAGQVGAAHGGRVADALECAAGMSLSAFRPRARAASVTLLLAADGHGRARAGSEGEAGGAVAARTPRAGGRQAGPGPRSGRPRPGGRGRGRATGGGGGPDHRGEARLAVVDGHRGGRIDGRWGARVAGNRWRRSAPDCPAEGVEASTVSDAPSGNQPAARRASRSGRGPGSAIDGPVRRRAHPAPWRRGSRPVSAAASDASSTGSTVARLLGPAITGTGAGAGRSAEPGLGCRWLLWAAGAVVSGAGRRSSRKRRPRAAGLTGRCARARGRCCWRRERGDRHAFSRGPSGRRGRGDVAAGLGVGGTARRSGARARSRVVGELADQPTQQLGRSVDRLGRSSGFTPRPRAVAHIQRTPAHRLGLAARPSKPDSWCTAGVAGTPQLLGGAGEQRGVRRGAGQAGDPGRRRAPAPGGCGVGLVVGRPMFLAGSRARIILSSPM